MTGQTGMNGLGRNNRPGLGSRGIGVQQAIRPVIQIAMDTTPVLTPTTVAQAANVTFSQNQVLSRNLQGVQVDVGPAGVATVRGTATTERERTMAAALLSLEPGVRAVQNEIVVNPATPPAVSATLPPPATPIVPPNR